MDRIMSLPRAKELQNWDPPEPSLSEVRVQYGAASMSDDDLLLRYIIGSDEDIRAMRQAGPPRPDKYLSVATPLQALISELMARRDLGYVSLQARDLRITIER